jgi:hypothetical protein
MTRKNIHALSGIRTRDPNNQPAKTHASDRTVTVAGSSMCSYRFSLPVRIVPESCQSTSKACAIAVMVLHNKHVPTYLHTHLSFGSLAVTGADIVA